MNVPEQHSGVGHPAVRPFRPDLVSGQTNEVGAIASIAAAAAREAALIWMVCDTDQIGEIQDRTAV